jgi:uncharacterized protein YegL
MEGAKIEQLKRTIRWLTHELDARHRVFLITFNEAAERKIPLTVMNDLGKATLLGKVSEIDATGGTNISAAIELGAAVVNKRV